MVTQRISARHRVASCFAVLTLSLCSVCLIGVVGIASAQDKAASPAGALPPLAPAGQAAAPAMPADAGAVPAPTRSITTLYAGQAADQALLTAAAWGGGSASITSERAYSPGSNSIKIVTRGPYQGGRLILASPAQLGDLTADKTRYLQMALGFVVAAPSEGNPDGTQFGPAGPGQGQPSNDQEGALSAPAHVFTADVFTANGHPGRFQLAQGRGYRPPNYGPPPGFRPPIYQGPPNGRTRPRTDEETIDIVQPPIKSLHLTFTFADGSETDVIRPVPSMQVGDHWLQMGIPLSQVPVPTSQAHNAQLQSVTVAGDTPTTLYVGQIRLISDALPITCSAGGEQDVARGDTVILKGKADAGAANIRYEWDFDTKSDFIPQAEGREVSHIYTQSGSYRVTLRVSDVDGLKAPAMSTTTIHIED